MAGEVVSHQPLEEGHQVAAFVTELWERYQNNKEEVMERWKEVQEYRNATDTTEISNFPDTSDHTVHIPLIEKIAPQLEAIILQTLIPHENWFDLEPYDKASASLKKRHNIREYLKNRYRVSDLNLTLSKWVSDIVDTGNGFLQMGFINSQPNKAGKTGYVGPKTLRISPFDIVFDPVCENFHDSFKIVREMVSVGELWKRVEDGTLDGEQAKDLFNNRANFNHRDRTSHKKDAQYVPAGFQNMEDYYQSGYVELLWFYGSIFDSTRGELIQDRTIVVADAKHLLMDEETASWDGKPYITHTGWQPRQDNLWYRGPLENLIGMNYMANHRENTKATAMDKMIYPDELLSGDIEPLFDPDTGKTTYLAPEGGATIQEIGVNTQFLSFDTQIDRMDALALQTIGLPPQFMGFRTAGEKTLGEVTALNEGAMRPFLHKLRNMERSLEFMLNAHLQLTYDNAGDITKISLKDEDGLVDDVTLTKTDFDINGGFVARGASRFSQKQKFMTDLIQITSAGMFQFTQPHWSSVGMSQLIADFMELGGEDLISPWVSIEEQQEAQQAQVDAQRQLADQVAGPNLTEEMINAEEEGFEVVDE